MEVETKKKQEISKRKFTDLKNDLVDAEKDLKETQDAFNKVSKLTIMDDCPICEGTGNVEDGTGDPAYNPYGRMLYRECSRCEGKGYLPERSRKK